MVQLRSVLKVADNSGVKYVRRIQVLRTIHRSGQLGDHLVCSVLKAIPESSLKKGDLVRGYLVRSVYGHSLGCGIRFSYQVNNVVLVNKKGDPLGTRVLCVLPIDLRRKGLNKILSLAPKLV
jgi:large subunit ribosomal protein L14